MSSSMLAFYHDNQCLPPPYSLSPIGMASCPSGSVIIWLNVIAVSEQRTSAVIQGIGAGIRAAWGMESSLGLLHATGHLLHVTRASAKLVLGACGYPVNACNRTPFARQISVCKGDTGRMRRYP